MRSLRETFMLEMADLYDAEKQIIQALPKMAKAAQDEELRHALEEHLEETEEQVTRLEQVFEILGEKAKGKKCKGVEGLLKEGEEIIKQSSDAALICAAQKVEHYEIAAYGSLLAWARLLGDEDAADLLEETLDEEKSADEKLTQVAETAVNLEEQQAAEQPKRKAA
jgi:ferritin-like metal-binding protein YciE